MPAPYYRFDGSNDVIDMGDEGDLEPRTTDFSLCAWIRQDIVAEEWFIGKIAGSGGSGEGYGMKVSSSGKLELVFDERVHGGSLFTLESDSAIEADKWYHFVGIKDGITLKIYLNGVEQADTANATADLDIETASSFYIGTKVASTSWWNGSISGVQFYNLALSATEVKELYSGASVPFKYKGANQTDLVTNGDFANWTGDDPDNWTVVNEDGSNIITEASGTVDWTSDGSAALGLRQSEAFEKGKTYRFTFTLTMTSGTARIMPDFDSATGATTYTTSGTKTLEVTQTSAATRWGFGGDTNAADFVLDNVSVVQIGAVAEYDGSGVGASRWDDKSGNELHGTITAGATAPTVENAPADADSGLTYEEGTWTPTLIPSGTGFDAITYDPGVGGKYTKIGNLVHIKGFMRTDSITVGSASGTIRLGGLPFTVAADSDASLSFDGRSTLNISAVKDFAGEQPNTGFIEQNTTTVQLLYRSAVDGATADVVVADVDTGANDNYMFFSGTYAA
jgi:hypothetical protein